MIINTNIPSELNEKPLKEQEKYLSDLYIKLGEAEREIFEKLSAIRGKISLGDK